MRYTEGLDFDAFVRNELVYDAVLRNLEVLGEAAEKVPGSIRARYPWVEWRAIAGLRDVLAHAYFALDDATLWDVVARKVPALAGELRRILEEENA
ncbi:HepT-like ribonuclease domain-containing protein [Thermus sp. FJN-A]